MGDISEHFDRREFACHCKCGQDTVDVELVAILEAVRHHFGQPVTITSGNRCMAHNDAVGGERLSQHLYGRAADFTVRGVTPDQVVAFLESRYADRYGIGLYKSWVHVDSRKGRARWSR